MNCSLSFGAPNKLRELIEKTLPGSGDILLSNKRICPRCKSKTVKTGQELNIEMNEVMKKYLKNKYPFFTFRPQFKQEAGNKEKR